MRECIVIPTLSSLTTSPPLSVFLFISLLYSRPVFQCKNPPLSILSHPFLVSSVHSFPVSLYPTRSVPGCNARTHACPHSLTLPLALPFLPSSIPTLRRFIHLCNSRMHLYPDSLTFPCLFYPLILTCSSLCCPTFQCKNTPRTQIPHPSSSSTPSSLPVLCSLPLSKARSGNFYSPNQCFHSFIIICCLCLSHCSMQEYALALTLSPCTASSTPLFPPVYFALFNFLMRDLEIFSSLINSSIPL